MSQNTGTTTTGIRTATDTSLTFLFFAASDKTYNANPADFYIDNIVIEEVTEVECSDAEIQAFNMQNGKYRYGFNGMERDDEVKGSGNSLDFGARIFDPRLGRWLSTDPLEEKFPNLSPYNSFGNDPLLFIDTDGKIINLFHIKQYNSDGTVMVSNEVSSSTQKAFTEVMQTKQGIAFFSMFAKKGEKLGNYTFTQDGELSNINLNIYDYSLENNTGQKIATSAQGSLDMNVNESNNFYVDMKIFSYIADDIGEVIMHESRLHGFKAKKLFELYKKIGKSALDKEKNKNPGGKLDHDELAKKDVKHEGYKNYSEAMKELNEVREKIKRNKKQEDKPKESGFRKIYNKIKNIINNIIK